MTASLYLFLFCFLKTSFTFLDGRGYGFKLTVVVNCICMIVIFYFSILRFNHFNCVLYKSEITSMTYSYCRVMFNWAMPLDKSGFD